MKKLKNLLISLFVLLMFFHICDKVIVNIDAASDDLIYNFESLHVDKDIATINDEIKVSIEVLSYDDVFNQGLVVKYVKPQSKQKHIVELTYNKNLGKFEGFISIDDTFEPGVYKVFSIAPKNFYGQPYEYYNEDIGLPFDITILKGQLSNANFEIYGTKYDSILPSINLDTLSVDKQEVSTNDVFKYSVKVDSNSHIQHVYLNFPPTDLIDINSQIEMFYNQENEKYEVEIPVRTKWFYNRQGEILSISSISASNEYGYVEIHNAAHLHTPLINSVDLSYVDVEIQENKEIFSIKKMNNYPLSRVLSNIVIEGDIYVDEPNTCFENVVVNGNIYVLSNFYAKNIKAKNLYCSNVNYDKEQDIMGGNGTVVLLGENMIENIIVDKTAVIPIEFEENSLVSLDGNISLRGRTLENVDWEVHGENGIIYEKIDPYRTMTKGRILYNNYIGDTDQLFLKSAKYYTGNDYSENYDKILTIKRYATISDGSINAYPKLNVEDITIEKDNLDNLKDYLCATAYDDEDGNLSDKITFKNISNVEINDNGSYEMIASVVDSDRLLTSKKFYVNVITPLKEITLSETKVTLNSWPDKCTLQVFFNPEDTTDSKNIKWTSSNENVAYVEYIWSDIQSFVDVEARNSGKTTITATTENGLSASCEVTVIIPPTNIWIQQAGVFLNIGESEKIKVNIEPVDATETELNWKSNDESIAKVDKDGIVTAISSGKTEIYVTTCNGLSSMCDVFVSKQGWVKENGSWYFYQDGNKATGWLKDSGLWYYMNDEGIMQTGWQYIDGQWYYLKNNMKTGWQKIDNKWYYLNTSMKTGWQYIDGKWYYLNSEMKTGWQYINGQWYYLNSEMKTGWQSINGSWYYLGTNGAMQTGWVQLNNKWYYLESNGKMVTGTHYINGKKYVFNSSGVWVG